MTNVDFQEENKLKVRRLALPTEAAIPGGALLLQGLQRLPALRSQLRSEGHSPLAGVVWATLTSSHDHAWLWLAAQTDTTVLASVVSIFPLSPDVCTQGPGSELI